MKYERIFSEVFRKPWAILPEKMQVITDLVALRAAGQVLSDEEIRERLSAAREEHLAQRAAAGAGAVSYGVAAVIPIRGIIQQRMNLMSQFSGGTSIEKLTSSFRSALADPAVKVIVFDVDSPGGGVEGVPELADEIYKSRGQKKSIAVANSMAASAAYWLASQAGELVVIPSGQIGSIGVFVAHEDISKKLDAAGVTVSLISAGKFKVDGNPYEPLSDSAREDLQNKVDSFYGMFVKSVARARGVSQASVREGFGQGRMVMANDAIAGKMADRVATMDETIARVSGGTSPRRIGASAEASDMAPGDDYPDDCGCDCAACSADACAECSNTSCMDAACKADGCPNQASAAAKKKIAPISVLEREVDSI